MYGEKIKRIREERGMTLHELGRQLKVRHSTVGAWENSTFPPLKAIHKICDYFNIQLWEFFIEDEMIHQWHITSKAYTTLALANVGEATAEPCKPCYML